jgi:hypothetical protein
MNRFLSIVTLGLISIITLILFVEPWRTSSNENAAAAGKQPGATAIAQSTVHHSGQSLDLSIFVFC